MKIEEMSLKGLALYVSHHLRKHGVGVVLTGGACVTIYTQNKYKSYDLDFISPSYPRGGKIEEIMGEIGFIEESGHFKHPQTQFFIEFLPPPLAVGTEPVKEIVEIKSGDLVLKLLSPTDCVKDRLAHYYHWNDTQALQQALLVSRDQPVDFQEVKRWSKREGMSEKFRVFESLLQKE